MTASAGDRRSRRRARRVRSGVLLLVGGVAIYLLLPSLLAVFGSWRSLEHLDWPFAAVTVAAETASLACLWELDRIVLRTKAWFPVIAAQLSGNAVGRILPGGGATATAFATTVLGSAGIDRAEAAGALTTSTLLQLATALSLPVVALPAILAGAPVEHSLVTAAYLGAAVLVLLLALSAAALLTDLPLRAGGRALERVLNATVRRRRPVTGLSEQLLATRDSIRETLGERWRPALLAAAGNTAFDYLALLAALRAVGASPHPSLVLLAYASAEVLALVPLTPGGLGFVEAGLAGTLSLAGVRPADALTATLLYRIVSYWLPLPAGGVVYLLFRRRYDPPRQRPHRPRQRRGSSAPEAPRTTSERSEGP